MATVTATDMDMARRRTAERRGNRAWFRSFDRAHLSRLIFASVCGIVLASVSAAQSAITIYDRRNPVLSEVLFGSDDARIKLWTAKAFVNPKVLRDGEIVGYARHALRRDPLNAAALRALAFYYDAAKKPGDAERLARLSDRVTRRDPMTQLLLTQYAARRGDIDGAIDRLDTALTTVGRGREQIFPIISSQLQRKEIREGLPRLLEPRNTWVSEYLDYAMRHDENGPKTVAEILLAAAPRNADPVYEKIGAVLMSSLAEAGEIELMRRTYARARGDGPDVTRKVVFDHTTINPAIGWLGWTGAGDGSAGAELSDNGGKVRAVVYASAGTNRALALRRVFMLAPGSYRHFEKRTSSFGSQSTIAQFEMKCIGDGGAVIWKGPAAGMDNDVAGAAGPVVKPGCQAQMLEMFVSSPFGSGGSEFVIEDFDLRRED